MSVVENDSACPWTKLADVETIHVAPFRSTIDAAMSIPGSKSVSNRALLMAAVADGPCALSGVLKSEDTYWTVESLRTLGVSVEIDGTDFGIVGNNFLADTGRREIYVGSAGTAARFLPGILAARAGETLMRGSRQMTARPIAPLVETLRAMGADVTAIGPDMHLPLRIAGGGFRGGTVGLSGSESSQYISGALIAAPLAQGPTRLNVEGAMRDYVGITVEYMRRFGIDVRHDLEANAFDVSPQPYRACDMSLEADASTATYFFSLAALTGGRIELTNLGTGTTQPDYRFTEVLERMGCAVERHAGSTVVTGPRALKGGFDIDMQLMSDASLTLGALAPFADAPIHIHNIAHSRKQESNRISVACSILTQLGIEVEERPDGFSIYPGPPQSTTIDPHEDHRVAMAFALTGLRANGIAIRNPSCVSKTCPDYFDMLENLGIQLDTNYGNLLA